MRAIKQGIIFLCCCLFTQLGYAKNLGVYGTTFEILEPDFKEFIYARLNQLQQNGELEKLNKRFLMNVKKHTLRPTPVVGLTTTNNPQTFYYDPTYVLKEDIKDAAGKVITAKGTIVNPFDVVTLHSVMLFFNAEDRKQIKWAKEESQKYSHIKYVLVQGNIKESGNTLADRVYFDQYGSITKQLGIKRIPSLVKQEGKRLKIQEFSLDEINNQRTEIETIKISTGSNEILPKGRELEKVVPNKEKQENQKANKELNEKQ
jgi:conjugal transfer pilus assembly protein TraW